MLKKAFKFIGYALGGLLALILLTLLFVYLKSVRESSACADLLGKEAPLLTVDGYAFRDLNKNGKLDVYEDSRANINSRIDDLAGQMNLEEKAGLMFITMAAMNTDGSLANTQIMPYYGIPVGQTNEDVGFGYNKQIITGMLRDKYHFDGVVCTDWGLVKDQGIMGMVLKPASAHGVEHLNTKERVLKILEAGCDMFGGEAIPDVVIELVKSGQVSEERINMSVKRILKDKFRLGLFDNPYVKPENATVVGNEKFMEKGRESQRRSLVLLKNDHILPLKAGTKLYFQGFDQKEIGKYKALSTSLQDADVIVQKLNTPYRPGAGKYLVERIFHQGSLNFPEEEKSTLLKLIQTKPTITVMNLERPAVFPEINNQSKAVIGDFSSQDEIILDLIFGQFKPTGKLPFELPSSMDAVLKQKEDVPYDSKDPLYPFGFGLSYE